MPYIKQSLRDLLMMDEYQPRTAGELNYIITLLTHNYLTTNGLSYQTINDILGSLEGSKMEFYRRIVVPYEDKAIGRNGDIDSFKVLLG